MLDNFAFDGIDISYVYREPNVVSGHALIMIGSEGSNYISVAPGANYRLTPEKIDRARPIIRDAALVIVQYEILPETLASILETSSGFNVPVLLNFAPAREFDLHYMKYVSILVVNEVEAEFLTGDRGLNRENVEQAARKLRDLGAAIVIVTLGKEGAFVLSEALSMHIDAFDVEAVDTTAAGDVFCGALGVAHVEGMPLDRAVRFASAASAISVTRLGAQPSAPSRHEIDAFIDEHGGL
jgi:ribokinase